jgi:DNA-binding CsgD family transcriptional regulator
MDEQFASYPSVESTHPPWLEARVEPGQITARLLARVLDDIDYGVILVDGSGEILLANRTARSELEASSRIRFRNNKLSGMAPKAAFAIERAITDAKNGSRQLVEIASSRGSLMLAFAPLFDTEDHRQAPDGCTARAVMVLMGKREALSPASLAEFARIHGISNAEQRLLPAICEGASIKEMARRQGISTCTVRAHLKSIRHKTGAPSLRPLMLQLMALPPVFPRLAM